MNSMNIKIKYFTDAIDRLAYIDGKSDWIDLRAAREVVLKKGDFALIPLGVAMELPKGYEAHIIKSKNANIVGQFFEQTDTAYSQIGIYKYVMSLVNNPMLYHEVEESVSILQKYDASHDVNLLETVISYVKNNGDFAKTSEELFQHSNTVRYRIRKAEQLLGLPDFATAEEMALIIRCYLLHNVMTLND